MARTIENLEDAFEEMFNFITDLPSGLDGFESDFDSAFKELRELKATPTQPNEALTLEQLREMDGQPVWVEEINHWALIDIETGGRWNGIPFAVWAENGVNFSYNIKARNLHCYRYPPEGKDELKFIFGGILMSYDISLCDPVSHEELRLDAPHDMRGGTYALGGTNEAWLNITYNYASWYYKAGVFCDTREKSKGIRTIYGKTGAESIPILKNAISALEHMAGEYVDENARRLCERQGITGYWLPTRENAIRPLYQLLAMAQMRPDGVWMED